MKGYTKLIQRIQDHTKSCIERFCTRQAKEIEILCTLNGGLKPHRDPKGRLHAAKDGYQDAVGKVYRKGQYIPMDFENENAFYSQPKYKIPLYRKIKLIDEMIEDVKMLRLHFLILRLKIRIKNPNHTKSMESYSVLVRYGKINSKMNMGMVK
ncbi:hypothetical protein [Vibrio phage phiKT1024]|nr:hypothetical protein [Vibrio phage phiKT1024]